MGPLLLVSLLQFPAAQQLSTAQQAIQVLPSIDSTFPDTTVVLPTNARLVASGTTDATFLLTRGDQSVVALDVEPHASTYGQMLVLPLPSLNLGEDIVLEPSCPACGTTFTFAVGDGDDVEAPAFAAGDVSSAYTNGSGGNSLFGRDAFEIDACLPPLVTNEPVLLQITGDNLAEPLLNGGGASCGDDDGVGVHFFVPGGDVREACFEIVAVDVAGNTSAPFSLCLDLVDEDSGCAQTNPMAPTALGLLLLGLRRRRSR
jgi:hypothetical protein